MPKFSQMLKVGRLGENNTYTSPREAVEMDVPLELVPNNPIQAMNAFTQGF